MSEHDRNLAEMDDDDVERHRVVQSLMQEAIDEVGRGAEGAHPEQVRSDLAAALAARGIGEQPARWVETVADRLVSGDRYVEGVRDA